jgi:hypothetical protein
MAFKTVGLLFWPPIFRTRFLQNSMISTNAGAENEFRPDLRWEGAEVTGVLSSDKARRIDPLCLVLALDLFQAGAGGNVIENILDLSRPGRSAGLGLMPGLENHREQEEQESLSQAEK